MQGERPEGSVSNPNSRVVETGLSPFSSSELLRSLANSASANRLGAIARVQAVLRRQFWSMRRYYDSAVMQNDGLPTWTGEVGVVSSLGHNGVLSTHYSVGVTSTDAGIGVIRTARLVMGASELVTGVELKGSPDFSEVSWAQYYQTRTLMGPGVDVCSAEHLESVGVKFTKYGVVVTTTDNPGLEFPKPRD